MASSNKYIGLFFVAFSSSFLIKAYNLFMVSLQPNIYGARSKAIAFGAIGLASVIIGLRLLFKKPNDKKLNANEKPVDIRVKCHACDKETFKRHSHEHLGVNICKDCREMTLNH